jgi:hypothetical protein
MSPRLAKSTAGRTEPGVDGHGGAANQRVVGIVLRRPGHELFEGAVSAIRLVEDEMLAPEVGKTGWHGDVDTLEFAELRPWSRCGISSIGAIRCGNGLVLVTSGLCTGSWAVMVAAMVARRV